MPIILDPTIGITNVDGTAAAPALTGTDTNTGVFFPAADTIAFAEGGVEAMRIDSSGNVGIGTSSLTAGGKLDVNGVAYFGTGDKVKIYSNNILQNAGTLDVGTIGSAALIFNTNNTERMRIDSSGRVGINTTSPTAMLHINSDSDSITPARFNVTTTGAASKNCVIFQREGTNVGFITVTNAATAYVTSSDYRLKENIVPMTGALDKVAQLNPVTYKWKIDGSDGQGFIAHELQAIVPDCVTGERDAVDEEGKPVYQGIDTSFLVATLTAAIQELSAKVDAQQQEINALKEAK